MDENTQFYTIILRHDDSTKWMINNPILALGEYGVEDDTHRVKRGDGQTLWSELSYEEFGLEYMITYKNLSGEVSDNEKLQKALDKKLNANTFENVGNTLTSSIKVTSGEKEIAQITRIGINVSNLSLEKNIVLIQSDDHSLTGAWSLSDDGVKTLNLRAQSAIDDYEKDHNYYIDQICFYNNILYRAIKDFTSTAEFNEKDWVKLASLHSDDIKYDNKISGLESRTVKEALDELKDLDNEKLQKTRRSYKIYGTNEDGEQTLYDKDALRTVDTVNGVSPNETSKNIQIDSTNINYDDNAEEKKTIKEILDSKVNNNVLGEDSVVTDIESTYDEQTGEIAFNIAKKQLSNGTESTKQISLNVVSEAELSNAISNVNANIETAKSELEGSINNVSQELNGQITQLQDSLNTKIDDETTQLNQKIDNTKLELNTKIGNTKSKLDTDIQNVDNAKIDKNIADSLVSNITVKLTDAAPTVQITNKNTDTKTEETSYIHFTTKGNIDVSSEADNIIIDATQIDKHFDTVDKHLSNVDTQLAGHNDSITALNKHISNHDDHLGTLDNQIADHETKIKTNKDNISNLSDKFNKFKTETDTNITDIKATNATQEAHLTTIDQTLDEQAGKIQANADSIVKTNENVSNNLKLIQANKDNIDTLSTNKLDKSFVDDIVSKSILDKSLNDNKLFRVNTVSKHIEDNAITNNIYDIVSTDNTLVSKPVLDESGNLIGIDLSTNLDIDVNYFLTSETLKTDIPSENVIRLDSLTATDKAELEVQDIISDSEGTWSRVKSIDKEDGTCVTVTYAKHAQAVWGTIKGDIANQTDLNTLIDNSLKSKLNTSVSYGFGGTHLSGYDNIISMYNKNLYTDKLEKTSGLNFYSQITDGTMFVLDQDDESNYRIKLQILPEYLTIDTQETGLTNTKLSPIIRELKTDLTSLQSEVSPLPRTVNSIEPTKGNILITPDNMKLTDFLSASNIRNIKNSLVVSDSDQFNTLSDLIRKLQRLTIVSTNNQFQFITGDILDSRRGTVSIGHYDDTDPLILQNQNDGGYKAEILGEYVKFDAKDSNLTSTEVGPAIRELKSTIDNKPGVSKYTKGNTYKEGDLVYLQKEGDTTCYLSVVIADFTADNTESNNVYQSFEADIASGYMLRVSIPNEA